MSRWSTNRLGPKVPILVRICTARESPPHKQENLSQLSCHLDLKYLKNHLQSPFPSKHFNYRNNYLISSSLHQLFISTQSHPDLNLTGWIRNGADCVISKGRRINLLTAPVDNITNPVRGIYRSSPALSDSSYFFRVGSKDRGLYLRLSQPFNLTFVIKIFTIC